MFKFKRHSLLEKIVDLIIALVVMVYNSCLFVLGYSGVVIAVILVFALLVISLLTPFLVLAMLFKLIT